MCNFWIILLLCIALHVSTCDGSVWLQDPPSRSAAWYYQIKTPVNYNFRNLDCGGVKVKINSDGTRNCGLCGDAFTDPKPRDNELGGVYANPRVRTRYYESGQVAEISLWNNLPGAPGFYEFRLCDEDSNQTQSCLDKHLLTIQDTGATYMPVPRTQGLVMVHLELPPDVTCDFCLLQWRFRKERLSGCDDENWCGPGRGTQIEGSGAEIEFYNCADVMIGAVGEPKPTFIEDPVYTASDYGSAYDVATTRTTPDGGNLVGSTTTSTTQGTTTNGVSIITIPTAFTTGTTNNPATTSGTTNNPASTSGTTNGPVTINTPGTTSAATIGPVPTDSRLVVDTNGNAIAGQSVISGGSAANNKYLLVLLSLLPLVGAFGLQNSRSVGAVAPLSVPPSAPVTWARALPLYPLQIDNTFGFGNFIAGNPAFVGTGGYGSNSVKGTYRSNSGYSSGYSVRNAGVTAQNTFALSSGNLNSPGTNSGLVGRFPANLYSTKTYPNSNVGGAKFVQNPVVWKNNGVAINNGFTSHLFPRSINFQNDIPYNPGSSLYSKPSGIAKSRLPRDDYGSNHKPGYSSHSNFTPRNPGLQVQPEVKWPRNTVQRVNSWQKSGTGGGIRNWQNSVKNAGSNNWQNAGGFGTVNSVNINRVGTGQRIPVSETVTPRMRIGIGQTLPETVTQRMRIGTGQRIPVPETVTQRMRILTSDVTKSDNSFNLPGIESASRFQINSPRQRTETSKPIGNVFSRSNGALIQNGDGLQNGATFRSADTRNTFVNNVDPSSSRTGTFFVNDWYNMLFRRFRGNPERLL